MATLVPARIQTGQAPRGYSEATLANIVPQLRPQWGRAGGECRADSNLGPVISRIAILPHPPLLVPELVGARDADVAAVRDTSLEVAGRLAESASRWLAVGAVAPTPADRGATTRTGAPAGAAERIGPGAAGTFRGFGVDVRVALGDSGDALFADPSWPLPALIAAWLRERVGAAEVTAHLVPADLAPADCAAEGARIAEELGGGTGTGLLVLGDGSHRHGERAVGRPDERAGAFDDAVADAMARADIDALLALDADLAAELGAIGRAPWQVLAGAVRADGRRWRSARSEVSTPFGVAYHFAVWEPVEP